MLLPSLTWAGNGANFVLYNQYTEEKGETEIELFSDFSNVGSGEEDYTAQLLEIERGGTATALETSVAFGNRENALDVVDEAHIAR